MFTAKAAFSGCSVNDIAKAKDFYTQTLGLRVEDETMGLHLGLPGGGSLFLYEKGDHQPATYTMLNFVVEDIDAAVDALTGKGVQFEHYEGQLQTDDKGIARGAAAGRGPDIAWFKDPAGNILAVIQD